MVRGELRRTNVRGGYACSHGSSDHCRTSVHDVLAGRGRPCSGSDTHLEECKHGAAPLLGECLSFVFVTRCDRDLQHHSLRRTVMCARMCVTVPVQAHELGAEISHQRILTQSKLLCMCQTKVLNPNVVGLTDKSVAATPNCSQLTPSGKERA